ncbi:MAG: hypothetical protein U5K31_10395 [Balneolaceae bacterium]|nr:hypothetical protein [Balneolaceae bacterium]
MNDADSTTQEEEQSQSGWQLNTQWVMTGSALFLGAAGLALSLFPQEILQAVDAPASTGTVIFPELAGALLFGFAFLNWMARGNIIGGIYSRPVAAGNFLHFMMGSIILGKKVLTGGLPDLFITAFILYLGFAAVFGYLLFGQGKACV